MSKRGGFALSATQQALAIAKTWRSRPTVKKGILRWTGQLQPSAVSPSYKVSLTYKLGKTPAVFVLEPALDPGHRERLPQVYSGDRLCLHTPGEWDSTMWLADTIVPWTAEWLWHYELWKATDHWTGGGHVYAPPDDDALVPVDPSGIGRERPWL